MLNYLIIGGIAAIVWVILALTTHTKARRSAVLVALAAGPKLGRKLPLRLGIRYVVLHKMENDGLILSEQTPSGERIYRLPHLYTLEISRPVPPELCTYAHSLARRLKAGNLHKVVCDLYMYGWKDGVKDVRSVPLDKLADDDALAFAVKERVQRDSAILDLD